jgi:hypothetical protein
VSKPQPSTHRSIRKKRFDFLLIFLAILPQFAPAQEPVRGGIWRSGMVRFEPGEQGSLFAIGPFRGTLTAGLSLYYTDNVGLTNTDTQDQLRLSENLNLRVHWPIIGQNDLSLGIGIGYAETIAGTRAGDNTILTLSPDSVLGFNFTVANLRFRLFDRFAIYQDPTSDSSVTGVVNLNRFRNQGGLAVDWDLNKLIVTAQVDDTYTTQNARTASNQSDVQKELLGVNGNRNTVRGLLEASFQLNPELFFGPQLTATQSSVSTGQDIQALAPGVFLRGRISRLTNYELEGGLNFVSNQGNHFPFSSTNQSKIPSVAYYVRAKLNQRVTKFLDLAGTVSHDLDYGDGINLIERTIAGISARYRVTKRMDLTVGGHYEDGNVLSGFNQGRYSLYEIDAGLTRRLGRNLQTSFTYRLIQRTSGSNGLIVIVDNQAISLPSSSRSYTQNMFTGTVTYAF